MEATIAGNGNRAGSSYTETRSGENGDRLKDLLLRLIVSSKTIDARVWLDGVYTDISDHQMVGDWMGDRDVYFKVEGRIDKRNDLQ